VVDLFLSLRDVKAYEAMIDLYHRMPLPLKRAKMMREQLGFALNRERRFEEAEKVLNEVIARAIQGHGARGLTDATPLARMAMHARAGRIYDGPDEVHRMVVARRILKGYAAGDLFASYVHLHFAGYPALLEHWLERCRAFARTSRRPSRRGESGGRRCTQHRPRLGGRARSRPGWRRSPGRVPRSRPAPRNARRRGPR